MTLDEALRVLADSHTRENHYSGFVVEHTRDRYGRWSETEYIEAWQTVRKHLHMQVEPQE